MAYTYHCLKMKIKKTFKNIQKKIIAESLYKKINEDVVLEYILSIKKKNFNWH